jgi:SAM-dependent methyltransferase
MAVASFSSADLETVSCRICGGTDSTLLFKVHSFPILHCSGCGVRYVSPRLKTARLLDLYSQEDYFKSDHSLTHGYHDYAAEKDNIIATFQQRLDWLMAQTGHANPGRLLDIGCALGFSVEYAVRRQWDAYGLEPSRYAAERAIQRLGPRVIHGTLDSAPFQAGSFQTLLLWDVIEHMPDPQATLQQAQALLAPGGVLSVITPDCESGLARMMGKYWMEYAKPTEHIYFFSARTLEDTARRAGFQKIAATTAGKQVSVDFLIKRLADHAPVFSFLKTALGQTLRSRTLYLDPKDKMHLIFQKE